MSIEQANLAASLEGWWQDKANQEIMAVVPKAIEYGANSMIDLGRKIATIQGKEVTDQEATELAVYFYVIGKIGRWTDALVAGQKVSDDTLHDIGVYIKMAQHNRERGGWPYPVEQIGKVLVSRPEPVERPKIPAIEHYPDCPGDHFGACWDRYKPDQTKTN